MAGFDPSSPDALDDRLTFLRCRFFTKLQLLRGVVHAKRFRFQAASCCTFCTWGLKPPDILFILAAYP